MEELMLKIDNVTKQYRLGEIGGTTLRDELQRLSAKIHGREDPTKRIGAKDYNKGETFMALNGVSFEVKKGERVGIIGHNGAGKSTLLKLISRVTAPTSGSIGLNGRVASMLEVGTGFHGELTGRENIYMNGAILGMTKKEIDAKMEDIIEFSECRQLHLDSEIMIMDEVLAVGDMAFQKKCLEKMSDVSKTEGRTILYVSHNMNTIRQLCDRVVVLDHGKVVFDGDVEEGIAKYMNCTDDARISYDYADYSRSPNERRTIQMLGLDIVNRNNNRIIIGEKLRLSLHCKANDDAEKIGLRFEIFAGNGSVIGTAFSDALIDARKGDIFDLSLTLNTNHFVPGRYRFVGLLYELGRNGAQAGIDRVDPALVIEVVSGDDEELVWLPQWWGNVKFDNIKTKKVDLESLNKKV